MSDEERAQRDEPDTRTDGGDPAEDERQSEIEQEMQRIEEDPPKDLKDWPDGAAKYETFGGGEGREGYHESVTAKLGPDGVVRHGDGRVEVDGEEVDDPDEHKMDTVDTSIDRHVQRRREKLKRTGMDDVLPEDEQGEDDAGGGSDED